MTSLCHSLRLLKDLPTSDAAIALSYHEIGIQIYEQLMSLFEHQESRGEKIDFLPFYQTSTPCHLLHASADPLYVLFNVLLDYIRGWLG